MDDVKWRSIPLIEIDWGITGCTGHIRSTLFNHSNPPRDPAWPQGHEWADRILGELADMGERVLPIFYKVRPKDNRPALAIQAARDFANGKIDDAARAAAGAADAKIIIKRAAEQLRATA